MGGWFESPEGMADWMFENARGGMVERAAFEDVVGHAVPALMENPEFIAVLDALDAGGDGRCTVRELGQGLGLTFPEC